MIVAVCLNAAVDVTYRVPALVPGETHRAESVHERAGGKGLNVARVLHQLGEDVRVDGFAGGATGALIRAELAAAGVPERLVKVSGESRRCVTLVDTAGATVVNEPGPEVSDVEWQAFLEHAGEGWADAAVVVLSGSLPRGVPDDAYAQLITIARRHGARTVVDAAGTALRAALDANPDVVKPNAAEAATALGHPVVTESDAAAAGAHLQADGAGAAVLSRGADGLVAVTGESVLRARVPRRIEGNPTGAGDALAAALARGLARGLGWADMLRDGVATSAAAVAVDLAGGIDPDVRADLLSAVAIEVI